ncbi:MAG: hypothetical protein ACYSU7_14010 [Planctomycetota bacterium]|jgi:hypothetical protein
MLSARRRAPLIPASTRTELNPGEDNGIDTERLLVIVVGAHLEAELADRPLGYRLRDDVARWQQETPEASPLTPVVCTDLWYLNARELMLRPTISVGRPGLNAVSAYFANRLPTAMVIDESLQIQLDPEFVTLQACVWGVDGTATRSGVELFVQKYLHAFLRSAHGL